MDEPDSGYCNDQSALKVAEALLEHYFSNFGVPQKLVSDMGTNFTSKLIKELCKLVGAKKIDTVRVKLNLIIIYGQEPRFPQ